MNRTKRGKKRYSIEFKNSNFRVSSIKIRTNLIKQSLSNLKQSKNGIKLKISIETNERKLIKMSFTNKISSKVVKKTKKP